MRDQGCRAAGRVLQHLHCGDDGSREEVQDSTYHRHLDRRPSHRARQSLFLSRGRHDADARERVWRRTTRRRQGPSNVLTVPLSRHRSVALFLLRSRWCAHSYYLHLFIVAASSSSLHWTRSDLATWQLSLAHAAFLTRAYVSALLSLRYSVYVIACLRRDLHRSLAFLLAESSFARGTSLHHNHGCVRGAHEACRYQLIDLTRALWLPGYAYPSCTFRESPGLLASKERFYYVTLAAAFATYFLCRKMVRSSIGERSFWCGE